MDNTAQSSQNAAERDLALLNKKLEGVEMPPELQEKCRSMSSDQERGTFVSLTVKRRTSFCKCINFN